MIARKAAEKVALVCDYLPRKCGIATFSHDVHDAIVGHSPHVECMVVPVTDIAESYDYPPEVRFEIAERELKAYRRAADFINFSDAQVVSLQHEFGLFGGAAGSHILTLMRELRMPIVTTLHTILDEPKPAHRRVMKEIVKLSSRLIVMSDRGRRMMEKIYGAQPDRIDVIAHGIPDMPFVDPNFYKDQFGIEGRRVILTFGLINPNKGIEYVIQALPEIVKQFPDVVYVILGATHPVLIRTQGEAYRLTLEKMVVKLKLTKHVVFFNRFVGQEELKEFIGAADLYVTPYLHKAQITSGALAYAFGCGKAVVSTPYWHAEELLAKGRGVLVPFRDSRALAREISSVLKDESRRHGMRKQAYLLGREMIWSHVASQMMNSFRKARMEPMAKPRKLRRGLDTRDFQLPPLELAHLERLSDRTGIFHNAVHGVPDFAQGYRTLDNAFALRLTVLIEETGDDDLRTRSLAGTFSGFLNHALIAESGRFHEHLSFERQWNDAAESDDTLAAVFWALGTCVGRSQSPGLQRWASQIFNQALPALRSTETPRAWAFGILGLDEYFRRLTGDRKAAQLRDILTERLLESFRVHSKNNWPWFESELSYAAARLPHALILSGRWTGNDEALQAGLKSLRWLMKTLTDDGDFRAFSGVSTDKKPMNQPHRDQFPAEASAAIAACLEAYHTTKDPVWREEARKAFNWFLGRNSLGESVYDPTTGGCCDALHVDRRNLNQGAESTLAFLLALQEMRLFEAEY